MPNADGYCNTCRNWTLDFPGLACPWCAKASADEARKNLNLDPDANYIDVLHACRAELDAIRAHQRQVFTLRSVAARALLRAGNIPDDIKAARTKLWAVERWAVADQPEATKRRLAPRQQKGTKAGMRIEYEERMARREQVFEITADDSIPERLRPSLGEGV